MRNGQRLRSRRSDPELASQELSEVLAAVRERPFSDDEDTGMEPVSPQHRDDDGDTATMNGSVIQHSIGLQERDSYLFSDEENDDPEQSPPRQRRPTYFDLHPERRPIRSSDGVSYERQSYDSDAFSTDSYGQFDDPPQARPGMSRRADAATDSYISEADYETTPGNSQIDVSDSSAQEVRRPPYAAPSQTGLPSAPAPPRPPRAIPVATPGATSDATKSKTASLIEMYRERERKSNNSPGPGAAPSKLPTRSVSLPQNPKLPVGAAPPSVPGSKAATAPTTTAHVSEPSVTESDVESEILEEIPEPNLPVRYVHGAPLHNVLEEEEEED